MFRWSSSRSPSTGKAHGPCLMLIAGMAGCARHDGISFTSAPTVSASRQVSPMGAFRHSDQAIPSFPEERAEPADAVFRFIPLVQYRDGFLQGEYVHVFLLRGALAIAITSVARGPIRVLVSAPDRCWEVPYTNAQLPKTGNADLNKDTEIFGWKKPPCCGDVPGRLGKESLMHVTSGPEMGTIVAYFAKHESYSRERTAEVFTFGNDNWTKSALGRKPHQSISSAFESGEAVWLTESIQDRVNLLQIRRGNIVSRNSAQRLPVKLGSALRRGLDLQVFPNGLGLSWGYLQDRRLIVDRWGNNTTRTTVAAVDDIVLSESVLSEFADQSRHSAEHPGLDFEYKSSEQFVLARRGEPRLRFTYDEAKQRWTSAEEAEPTTQEKIASLLNLNLEPKSDSDSVKVSGNRWVAVRRKDAEHAIEVFTNDDTLVRCGTITEEPYVYKPSESNREPTDAAR